MVVVGLTGGIGAGKSVVAQLIKQSGFRVLDMDSRAKELMTESEKLKAEIIKNFGQECYLEDGTLNRQFLSNEVFNNKPERVEKLNSIVHPIAIKDMMEFVKDSIDKEEETGEKLIFVEAALIFEAGLDEGFDYILMVDAPKEMRIERVMKRSGMTKLAVEERMKAQLSSEVKRSHADFVIDNNKSLEDLRMTTDFILDIIRDLPPSNKFTDGMEM